MGRSPVPPFFENFCADWLTNNIQMTLQRAQKIQHILFLVFCEIVKFLNLPVRFRRVAVETAATLMRLDCSG